jgi:hypothetical protein
MPLAFIDDSGSGGDSPYYILAGYSAPETAWAAFWPDWQTALDIAPKLEYFKMSEAESLKGQFLGFSAERRTQRVNQFIDVIQAHDLQEASTAVSAEAYRDIFYPVMHKSHASPYYLAFIGMVSALAGINRYSGSAESTDFIFDEQEGMENRALRMYIAVKKHFPERQFGRVAFRSDRQMIALQAADLVAWQIRRFRSTPGEPLRDELRRLHSCRRPPFRSTISRQDLQHLADVTITNIPNLRQEFGDARVDRFLQGIERRNRREGVFKGIQDAPPR